MEQLLRSVAERAIHYLDNLEYRSAGPSPAALINLSRLEEPLPDQATDAETVIALLDEIGSPATMATAGSRFFGFVVGGSLPVALAANCSAALPARPASRSPR